MQVSKIMTRNPVFIHPELSLTDARLFMDKERIGHLPVLNKNNELVGLITRADLIKAGPSSATSLDMYEISYLLSKLKVDKVMEKNVIIVQENEVVKKRRGSWRTRGLAACPY